MHEANISPPLDIARFFLTQQLIYKKRKIEKHNVGLDIFVSGTGIARKLHLPGEITFWLYKGLILLFWIRFT